MRGDSHEQPPSESAGISPALPPESAELLPPPPPVELSAVSMEELPESFEGSVASVMKPASSRVVPESVEPPSATVAVAHILEVQAPPVHSEAEVHEAPLAFFALQRVGTAPVSQ